MGKLHAAWALIPALLTSLCGCKRPVVGSADASPSTTSTIAPVAATYTPPVPTAEEPVDAAPPDFASQPAYRFDKANVDAFCRDEWTKRGELNGQMFSYCTGQETKGYGDMVATLKKFGKNPWMTALFPAIWTEWTKRDVTQYRMVAHSLKEQCDGYLDYQYALKQPSFDAAKMSACESQWRLHARRWTQTVYCYKND